MKIEYRTGDLLATPERVIVHGCNAAGAYGAGVALAIRKRLPWAYDAYMAAYRHGGMRPGDVVWADKADRVVANCITQRFYGRGKQVDYDALKRCLVQVNAALRDGAAPLDAPEPACAMPLIGAGLGGGDWGVIARLVEECLTDVRPVVYTLDGRVPGR